MRDAGLRADTPDRGIRFESTIIVFHPGRRLSLPAPINVLESRRLENIDGWQKTASFGRLPYLLYFLF